MRKKIVSALLCVTMAASLVVGCGSKSGSDSGSSKGGDKLVYWAMWSEDEPQAKVIKEAIVLPLELPIWVTKNTLTEPAKKKPMTFVERLKRWMQR